MSYEKKIKIVFLLILAIFVVVRLLGVHNAYHQDELRIAANVNQPHDWYFTGGHGPLLGFIYALSGELFGGDNMRLFPLFFGILNFILLFYLVKPLFGLTEAFWAIALFTASYYSVLASLMVDVDGQVLPFFLLLSLTSFYKWQSLSKGIAKWRWLVFLLLSLAAGFLTKFSFILVIGVLGLELFYQTWIRGNKRLIVTYGLGAVYFLGLLATALLKADILLPNYPLNEAIIHAKGYVKFSGRNYFQTLVQFVKALLYASPLLIAPLFFLDREEIRKLRIFIMFLLFGLLFYLVLFDFSLGALDKYFEFIIIPLSILGGVALARVFKEVNLNKLLYPVIIGSVLSLLLFFLQFIPHFVPPLWPKTEWINHVLNLKWNFLMPFTGGSGPMGFYVSWLFLVLNWFFVLVLVIWAIVSKKWRGFAMVIVVVLGVGYNFVFTEEYLFGRINGNVTEMVNRAANFIKENPQISKVITYNNNGGYELMKIGKYERRLYVAPKFESFNKEVFSNFKGHYLVIDIPRLDPESLYVRYFSLCDVVYEDLSKKISAKVYDCKNTIEF